MTELLLVPGKATLAELERFIMDESIVVTLDRSCKAAVEKAANVVSEVVKADEAVYGVNTGFGKLSSIRIAAEDSSRLQRNLILSHCAGVGELCDPLIVRLMMTLKLLSLGRGASGVRWELIEAIENLLNKGITPVVPEQGSVGASGDLAPLAHFSAALLGEGDVIYKGKRQPAGQALLEAGLQPIELIAKEGLALINGTQFSTASAILALHRCSRLVNASIISASLSTDAIMGSTAPLHPSIHELRGHQGQIDVASSMRALMQGSIIRESHRDGDTRVQDPYCIRCQPQVGGACIELLRQAAASLRTEANAVTDNPLIIFDDISGQADICSGGNFHAQTVAFVADQMALAIAETGAVSQRRIALMVDPALSFDLPPFLTPDPGLCSGFMVAEITSAALMSENKHLANPCSTDSTPTSANQEDHVSMAAHAATRLHRMNRNLMRILSIEILCAVRGIEFRAPLTTSEALTSVIAVVRQLVPTLTEDRYLSGDIECIGQLIQQDLVEKSGITVTMPALY